MRLVHANRPRFDRSTSVYRSNPRLWSGHPEAIQIAVHQSIEKKTEHLVTDRIVSELNARSAAHYQRSRSPEIQTCYYHFMTALVDSGHVSRKNLPFDNFCTTDLRLTSQAFGREPNALPKLCNCYAYSTITAPDKGEVTFRVSSTRARAFGIGLSQRCSCDC